MTDNHNPKITTRWRFTDEKLSPAWLRLIAILSASRQDKPSSAGQPTADTQAEKRKSKEKEAPPPQAPEGGGEDGPSQ